MAPLPPALIPLKAGDLLHLGRPASVQFATHPITFRLIRVLDRPTFDGWLWIDGYQLNAKGDAVTRRELFVQPAGIRKLPAAAPAPRRGGRQRPSSPAQRSQGSAPQPARSTAD